MALNDMWWCDMETYLRSRSSSAILAQWLWWKPQTLPSFLARKSDTYRHLLISKPMRCPCFFPSPVPVGAKVELKMDITTGLSRGFAFVSFIDEAPVKFVRGPSCGGAVRWSGAAAGKVDVMRLVPTCSHPVGSQLNMWWSFEVWGLLKH